MKFLPLDRMLERVEIAKDDSDMSLFMNLMYTGEMITKCVVAGMVAAVVDGRERKRYSAVHKLVRADGLGDWAAILDEILTGPTAQFMNSAATDVTRDLTERCSIGSWQFEAVTLMNECLVDYGIQEVQELPGKIDARRWFRLFTDLRNKSRAHGAPQSGKCALICQNLERSIRVLVDNLSIFNKPWAYLHRNFSGKYRVTKFVNAIEPFDYLKSSGTKTLPNFHDGIYIYYDEPRFVELMYSDPDAFDFFLPNGGFTDKKFELISYITDAKNFGDSSLYLLPTTGLPESETQGRGILDQQGKCFGNLPPVPKDYICRPMLEEELFRVLSDDRHPIVTLVGRGGIGKTWLALNVLHQITNTDRYEAIIWFSARDIDLLIHGPKSVKPQILDEKDIATEFSRLIEPPEAKAPKSFKPLDFFAENLGKSRIGPILYVFDNFETVKNPVELYTYLDTYLRLPNKILITTRIREFKADYHVEVTGMNEQEAEALINSTSLNLSVDGLITEKYKEEIFQESEGHPYVIKILLGEVAKAGKLVKIERIVADSEEILKALFERTYVGLSPVAKRVFLTLCNWRSMISELALEAILLKPTNERMDVLNGIEELIRSSFVEIYKSEKDQTVFISVPLVAMVFGKKKLAVSPMKSAIEADTILLRAFGSVQPSDLATGIGPRIEKLFRYMGELVNDDKTELENHLPMLEFIASKYPRAWLMLASLYEESGVENRLEKAKQAVQRFLEEPGSANGIREAWRIFATYCNRTQDWLGEIHALIEIAQLPGMPVYELSNIANTINNRLRFELSKIDSEEKRILVNKMIDVLENNIEKADATDLSRIAWLAMNIQDEKRARRFTEMGLELDPYNEYIQSLATHLKIY